MTNIAHASRLLAAFEQLRASRVSRGSVPGQTLASFMEDEAERLVARASVTVPLHNRSEYSYVANPEEVRAMRPEQFDFKLPPTT